MQMQMQMQAGTWPPAGSYGHTGAAAEQKTLVRIVRGVTSHHSHRMFDVACRSLRVIICNASHRRV